MPISAENTQNSIWAVGQTNTISWISIGTQGTNLIELIYNGYPNYTIAAAYTGIQSGEPDLVTYDMGGTSTDVALIQNGLPSVSSELDQNSIGNALSHCFGQRHCPGNPQANVFMWQQFVIGSRETNRSSCWCALAAGAGRFPKVGLTEMQLTPRPRRARLTKRLASRDGSSSIRFTGIFTPSATVSALVDQLCRSMPIYVKLSAWWHRRRVIAIRPGSALTRQDGGCARTANRN